MRSYSVSVFCGPTLVQGLADALRAKGAQEVYAGTERVYFVLPAAVSRDHARFLALSDVLPSWGFRACDVGTTENEEREHA